MSGGYQPQPSTSNGISRNQTETPLNGEEMMELNKLLGPAEQATNAIANQSQSSKSPTSNPVESKKPPNLMKQKTKLIQRAPDSIAAPAEEESENTVPNFQNLLEAAFIARGESMQEICVMTTPTKDQQDKDDANSSSILNTPSPSIQSAWSNIQDNAANMSQMDTLDRNPVVVNPHSVQDIKVEHHHGAQQIIHQQEIVQATGPHHQQFEIIVQQPEGFDPLSGYQDALQLIQEQPSPTGFDPCFTTMPGDCDFSVSFDKMTSGGKNKHWDFSTKLHKLYIDMNKDVLASFNVGSQPTDGLVVRVLPIYAQAGFYRSPVKRCPNHASPEDPSNRDPIWSDKRDHLIRVANEFTIYDEDPQTKRLSVMIPVKQPSPGSTSFSAPIKFMCLGSDTGGINRKPVKLIFTLELGQGNVIGRQSVEVRICSCPKRDKKQEEERHDAEKIAAANSNNRNSSGGGASSSGSAGELLKVSTSMVYVEPPAAKKRKIEGVEEFIMVPVPKSEFGMINTMAETYMFARHTDSNKREMIRNHRKKLLRQHNPGKFAPPCKPAKDDGDKK